MAPDAVLFDLDGLLIDSEPLWIESEQAVFAALGVFLTEQDCSTTTGMRTDEVVRHWFERYPELAGPVDPVAAAIVDHMVTAVSRRGVALPGAVEAVELAAGLGRPVGLVSSSPVRLISAALQRLGVADQFAVVASAEHERRGKPDPAVYITAAARLEVRSSHCVAIEDSPNGVRAAKQAGMRCVAVPTPAHRDTVTGLADLVLDTLVGLSPTDLAFDL